MTTPKYPHIEVELVGQDGNAFFIIGRVAGALRRGRVAQVEIDEFTAEAMSGDYNKVLTTAMEWVNCFPGDDEDDDPWETDDQYEDYEDDDNPYDDDLCDRCSEPVANGHGEYPDDGTGDRICSECAEKVKV